MKINKKMVIRGIVFVILGALIQVIKGIGLYNNWLNSILIVIHTFSIAIALLGCIFIVQGFFSETNFTEPK